MATDVADVATTRTDSASSADAAGAPGACLIEPTVDEWEEGPLYPCSGVDTAVATGVESSDNGDDSPLAVSSIEVTREALAGSREHRSKGLWESLSTDVRDVVLESAQFSALQVSVCRSCEIADFQRRKGNGSGERVLL